MVYGNWQNIEIIGVFCGVKMDKTDPICGMKGTILAHGHYFCSEHCIRKYEEEKGIIDDKKYCPSCTTEIGTPWYKERLFIVIVATLFLLVVGYVSPLLKPFFDAFIDYLALIWWALLLGFLFGGVIDYFIPREYIKKYLSRHRKRTIIYSIVFGFLMSACSHGILAIAIELYKKGASTSSVVAFLLAAPWANLPITILLFGFFGVKATFIVVSALIIAVITGLIYQGLERRGMVECKSCIMGEDMPVLTDFSIIKDIQRRWKEYDFTIRNNIDAIKGTLQGSWSLTRMVMWWLVVGMVMASFARAYVPQHLFVEYMGPTLLGLLVTLFFATIIEVCSEGSSPLAFEIFNQTGAFGNSFTFLMAGVATDYTEIGIIWHNIGKKAALWLPIITVPQILVLGYLFNIFT
ncbi:MAG: permease [Candidatus Thermoplasmatota archaeon]|nr:permease [Candidatus Thermoplasmatota archaeon]